MKKATAAETCAKWMQENECKTYRDLEAITKTVSLSIMSCPLIRPRSAIYCMIGVLLATGGTPQGLGLMASLLGSSLWVRGLGGVSRCIWLYIWVWWYRC